MRSIFRLTCLGLLILAGAGCESTRWNFLKREPGNDVTAAKPGAPPTVVNLVAYLNDNAKRVSSVRFDDVAIDATMNVGTINPQTVGLSGRLFAEKPRNFRLKASVLGKDEADIGSNAQEFWFWIRQGEPRQYFCAYKDLEEGKVQMMPLPIQPEWVMETLGLGPYGPAEKYQLELDKDGKMLRLIEKARSPTGQPVRKVIVMNRKEVDWRAGQPQVTAYLLVDDTTGQEICSAHISTIKVVNGVALPYKMELRMPVQKMKMALKMDRVVVNSALPGTAFVRPQNPGIDPFNLATGRVEAVQRAQGTR